MENEKLIFLNVSNRVPMQDIMLAFEKSEKEIVDILKFISGKIKSYVVKRGMPFIPCDTIEEIRNNRLQLLNILDKLDLTKPAEFKVLTQSYNSQFLAGIA